MKKLMAVAALLVAAAACSDTNGQGEGDAPVGSWDDSKAFVINFPDRFHNIAFKCLGPNGIYTHTRDAAPVVVPHDSNCGGDG